MKEGWHWEITTRYLHLGAQQIEKSNHMKCCSLDSWDIWRYLWWMALTVSHQCLKCHAQSLDLSTQLFVSYFCQAGVLQYGASGNIVQHSSHTQPISVLTPPWVCLLWNRVKYIIVFLKKWSLVVVGHYLERKLWILLWVVTWEAFPRLSPYPTPKSVPLTYNAQGCYFLVCPMLCSS